LTAMDAIFPFHHNVAVVCVVLSLWHVCFPANAVTQRVMP